MKGIVFTQFLEMVEREFGFDIVDKMIDTSSVSGIYTQGGNYPVEELFKMVKALANLTEITEEKLIFLYGKELFSSLVQLYPKSVEMYSNSFEFISNVGSFIHPEVVKLYPDSVHPTFELISINEKEMKILYKSTNALMALASGLMAGCVDYYNDSVEISYEKKPSGNENEYEALFTLIKKK